MYLYATEFASQYANAKRSFDMKNLLKLHEAIAVVLLNEPKRTASLERIALVVNRRKLYTRADQKPVPAYQVMMRAKLNKGRYAHLLTYNSLNKTVTLTQ